MQLKDWSLKAVLTCNSPCAEEPPLVNGVEKMNLKINNVDIRFCMMLSYKVASNHRNPSPSYVLQTSLLHLREEGRFLKEP